MFADKSMQGLTFLLSAFLCQVGKTERPCPALDLQMASLALLSDGARLQMGSPEAGWSKLLLSGPVPRCSHEKEAQESDPGCMQPGAGSLSMCSFMFPDPMPSWATPEGRHSFAPG